MIKIFDNKVPYDTMQQIYDFVCRSNYNLGWSDSSFEKWSRSEARFQEKLYAHGF